MRNPFYDRKFSTIYAVIWGVMITAQVFVLHLVFDIDIVSAILQSFVQNSSFAVLGIGIWYVVKYSMGVKRNIRTVIVFISSGLLIVIIWMGFNFVIENLLEKLSEGSIVFKRHHMYQFTIGVFLFSIFALSYRLLIVFHNYNEKTKSEEKLKTMLTETKLNALKAYVNPHFLFNSLNSVNALITIEPEKAREMIVNLSDYFRYSLKQKDIDFIRFEDELHYTKTYFDIEKQRFGDRVEVEMEFDNEILDFKVPVMILQPLFENVIKHAVSESLEIVKLKFNAEISDNKLKIEISNNYDPESISHIGSGIGLSTTAERLHLIYGNRNLLKFTKKDGIFKVILEIPESK